MAKMTQAIDASLIARDVLPADRHPAAVYLASLSKGSLPGQRSALRQVASLFGADLHTLDWGKLRYQHVQWIRARLSEQHAPSTVNKVMTALRRVMREAWLLGYLPEDDYKRIMTVGNVKTARDDTEADLTGRFITVGELTAIMAACASDKTPAGARDAAIIALGYGLGLRRVEICRLRFEDYDQANQVLHIRGKGGKSRALPIDDGALDALTDWLAVRGNEPGAMFYGVNKGGKISSRQLNQVAVHELYVKRAQQAGVKDSDFHDLRRSFITTLLDSGVDVSTVARLAGHSDPRTTMRYDRRKMETRRKAIRGVHVPYVRREQ